MANTWGAISVKCPFFVEENTKRTITCEGLVGVKAQHDFGTATAKYSHKKQYCDDVKNCKNCKQYKALMRFEYADL